MQDVNTAFLIKEGQKVGILGKEYVAAKQHILLGINLWEGKLKILSNGEIKNYTYEELSNSELVAQGESKEHLKEVEP